MKRRLTQLVVGLSLLGMSMSSFSATSATSDQSEKMKILEQQLHQLQKEMAALRRQNPQRTLIRQTKKRATVPTERHSAAQLASDSSDSSKTQTLTSLEAEGRSQIEGPTDLPSKGPLYMPVDLDVPGQSFVSSGPYIGIPLEFTGGHLLVNSPSVNQDVILLQVSKNINQRLNKMGRSSEDVLGSHILLSGVVEGQALYRDGGGVASQSDIDLTSVNFDVFIMGPSQWTSAFIEFAYDNNIGTQTGSFSSNDRMFNSHVFVNKAFVMIGDFQKSPFYASFGQMYIPFGTYSTTMISGNLTKILARTPARAIVFGYKQQSTNSLLASAYIFQGPSHASATHHVNNGGVNISYNFTEGNYIATVGGGVIGNIADSAGMQITGNNNSTPPLFGGFGGPIETFTVPGGVVVQEPSGNEQLVHRVPAYDINLKLGLGSNFQLIGEYITASTHFDPADLTFNGDGAKPRALNIEGIYNMPWFVNPTSISISYQMSKDALAIGLPAKRYSLAINRSFWKNTLQTLEFRRDKNYAEDNTSSGSGIAGPTGTGKYNNMVTLQFDYYF